MCGDQGTLAIGSLCDAAIPATRSVAGDRSGFTSGDRAIYSAHSNAARFPVSRRCSKIERIRIFSFAEMDHHDHVSLLRRGVPSGGGTWADFGSGEGAFTLALCDLIGPAGEIWSIDKDRGRLDRQRQLLRTRFPGSNVHLVQADLTRPLELPPLDGVVMANSLHFFRNKENVLRQIREYLKENARLVLVEYNVDSGNAWVPHPLSFDTFRVLAPRAGFSDPQLLATAPSHFLGEFYSALAFRSKMETQF
jgi:ubiquinone/menaquinone biosynthesis C-methylase UbiE